MEFKSHPPFSPRRQPPGPSPSSARRRAMVGRREHATSRRPKQDDARRTVTGRSSGSSRVHAPHRYGERSYPRCADWAAIAGLRSAQQTGPRPCRTRRPRGRTASSPRHAPGAATQARQGPPAHPGSDAGPEGVGTLSHGETAPMAALTCRARSRRAGTGGPMTATQCRTRHARGIPAASAVRVTRSAGVRLEQFMASWWPGARKREEGSATPSSSVPTGQSGGRVRW